MVFTKVYEDPYCHFRELIQHVHFSHQIWRNAKGAASIIAELRYSARSIGSHEKNCPTLLTNLMFNFHVGWEIPRDLCAHIEIVMQDEIQTSKHRSSVCSPMYGGPNYSVCVFKNPWFSKKRAHRKLNIGHNESQLFTITNLIIVYWTLYHCLLCWAHVTFRLPVCWPRPSSRY